MTTLTALQERARDARQAVLLLAVTSEPLPRAFSWDRVAALYRAAEEAADVARARRFLGLAEREQRACHGAIAVREAGRGSRYASPALVR